MIYLAHFFAACFLMNSVPHLVSAMNGTPFTTPFGKPPGVGLSSPVVNVIWGGINFVAGFLLLSKVGPFSIDNNLDVAVTLAGALLTALGLAHYFTKLNAAKTD